MTWACQAPGTSTEVEVVHNHLCGQILCCVSSAGWSGSDGQMPPSHEVERDYAVALSAVRAWGC